MDTNIPPVPAFFLGSWPRHGQLRRHAKTAALTPASRSTESAWRGGSTREPKRKRGSPLRAPREPRRSAGRADGIRGAICHGVRTRRAGSAFSATLDQLRATLQPASSSDAQHATACARRRRSTCSWPIAAPRTSPRSPIRALLAAQVGVPETKHGLYRELRAVLSVPRARRAHPAG